MAIANNGLVWHPLYWMHHDQWQYYHETGYDSIITYDHYGHMHFFMLGLDMRQTSDDAFSGTQVFDFSMEQTWGPDSRDLNQMQNYRIIGTPRWYFHVTELWRRVYIQPWDSPENLGKPQLECRGLKYDASDKVWGPFREGRNNATGKSNFPYWASYCRTLPVEYFRSYEKTQTLRDNYVQDRAQGILPTQDYDQERYRLDCPAFFHTSSYGGKLSNPGHSDAFYIWPIIEYQAVVQLNWERLPGWEARDKSDTEFGDGWSQSVTVPFVDPLTGKYNSPFGPEPGKCTAAGNYFGANQKGEPLVADSKRFRYNQISYSESNPYRLPTQQPAETSGQHVEFHNPYTADGRWVQQCLGGIVQARALVTVEHRLGGRQDIWVSDSQYVPTTAFSGTDQMLPAQGG